MDGSIIQGDFLEDALRLAFLILPFIAAGLFVLGAVHEADQPSGSRKTATAIYGGAVILVATQLILPALP